MLFLNNNDLLHQYTEQPKRKHLPQKAQAIDYPLKVLFNAQEPSCNNLIERNPSLLL